MITLNEMDQYTYYDTVFGTLTLFLSAYKHPSLISALDLTPPKYIFKSTCIIEANYDKFKKSNGQKNLRSESKTWRKK